MDDGLEVDGGLDPRSTILTVRHGIAPLWRHLF